MTGTDTEVGKTVVAGAIAAALHGRGLRVGVFKPVATGCLWQREGLVSSDAAFLAACAHAQCPLSEVTPARYLDPVAPLVAVERSGRAIDWDDVARAYAGQVNRNDVVVVEGIGGVMVPIEKGYAVLDLMREMNLPVVIVAASRLGAINHTLLTLEVCRRADLQVAAVVLNGHRPAEATLAEETNPRVIQEVAGVPILSVIPYDEDVCVDRAVLGAEAAAAAATVDWLELAAGRQGR